MTEASMVRRELRLMGDVSLWLGRISRHHGTVGADRWTDRVEYTDMNHSITSAHTRTSLASQLATNINININTLQSKN